MGNEGARRALVPYLFTVGLAIAGVGLGSNCARSPEQQKQTPPSPTSTITWEPTKTPTAISIAEKPPETGWLRFRSSSGAYQIDLPNDWKVGESPKGKNPPLFRDDFSGIIFGRDLATVIIIARPIDEGTTLEDYAKNYYTLFKQDSRVNEVVNLSEEVSKAGVDAKEIFGREAVNLVKTKVAEQNTQIIYANLSLSPTIKVGLSTAIFLTPGKAWQIMLNSTLLYGDERNIPFQKMLSSFKFLQSETVSLPLDPTPRTEEKLKLPPSPTKVATEKPPEQGGREFTSVKFPYKMIIPPTWNTSGISPLPGFSVYTGESENRDIFTNPSSKKFGNFYQTTISVSRTRVGEWVKAEDYAQQKIVALMNAVVDLGGGRLPERFRPKVERIIIAGKEGVLITGREVIFDLSNEYAYALVMFTHKGYIWSIALYTDPEETSRELPGFKTRINSLKLLE